MPSSRQLPVKVRDFMAENDRSRVVEGATCSGGGGTYWLANGKRFDLSLAEMRALPANYPVWDHPEPVAP